MMIFKRQITTGRRGEGGEREQEGKQAANEKQRL